MGLFGKSIQSGFGREIGKNTGKIITNSIFGNNNSTAVDNTLEKNKKQSEQIEEEKETHQRKLEPKEPKLQGERKEQEQKFELQSNQKERAQKNEAKIAIEIKKYDKNIVGELKKLKGLLDDEMLTQEEYIILKERLLIYL